MEAILRAFQKDRSCWAHNAEFKPNLLDIDGLSLVVKLGLHGLARLKT
jgi:hypothetical protein